MREPELRLLEKSVERGTAGHLLAQLLGILEGSPQLGAVVQRMGPSKLVEAARCRRAVMSFVTEVTGGPRHTWQEALKGGREHHGPLMVIGIAHTALRRLPGRPLEAMDLVEAARSCAGEGGFQNLDLELRLLLEAIEALAQMLCEDLPARNPSLKLGAVAKSLEGIHVSIHAELVADTWWLVAVGRRLVGKFDSARAALERAVGWARFMSDEIRLAQFHLEDGLVLELAGRFDEACAADALALRELQTAGETPWRDRASLQRAMHLVEAGRWEEGQRVVERWGSLTESRHEAAVLTLRGRLAQARGEYRLAENLLRAASDAAARDRDLPSRGLTLVARVGLLDEMGRLEDRQGVVKALRTLLLASPSAPAELSTAVAELEQITTGERLGSQVVSCLRRRMRAWQARESTDLAVRVM